MLVDGAQAAPHEPVNVQELGCDFFVFSGHKTLGPPGSGALWARREILEEMPPFMGGGEMIREVNLRHTTFNDVPFKFEAGTPDIAAAIGLGAALDYLDGIGMEHVRAHENDLIEYALDVLPERCRASASTAHSVRGSRRHRHLQPRRCAPARRGHAARPRGNRGPSRPPLHMPLHQRLGEEASARASFYIYTDREDIDRLAEALNKVERLFARQLEKRKWTTFTETRSSSTTATPTTSAPRDADHGQGGRQSPVWRPDHADARHQ